MSKVNCLRKGCKDVFNAFLVKNAVYDSFYASKAKNNLVYMYNDITDSPRKSRVRVLTRMLWYSLYYH